MSYSCTLGTGKLLLTKIYPKDAGASQVAQWYSTRLPVQEMQVRSLGWEEPLEKEMATHSSILVWEIPWTEQPGGLQCMGLLRAGHD